MSILRSIAVPLCLVGGIFVWTNLQVANHRAEAIETYGLSNAAVEFMDGCTSSLKDNNLGISRSEDSDDARRFNTKACGCIASKIGEDGATDATYSVAQEIFTFMVEARSGNAELNPAKVLPALLSIGTDNGMEAAEIFPLMGTVSDSLATCARDKSV